MTKTWIVQKEISIQAPVEKVWEVLIMPKFIRQWDDLPDSFGENELTSGSVIEWTGYSILTVVTFEPLKQLRQTLYSPQWELPPSAYDIAYTYTLSAQNNETLLTIQIGDFAQLPDGERFYEASVELQMQRYKRLKNLRRNRVFDRFYESGYVK